MIHILFMILKALGILLLVLLFLVLLIVCTVLFLPFWLPGAGSERRRGICLRKMRAEEYRGFSELSR